MTTRLFDAFGLGCWVSSSNRRHMAPEVESMPDATTRACSRRVRERQAVGRAATGVDVGGKRRPASPGSLSSPKITARGRLKGNSRQQGYLALANNNLTYPAIAIGASGKGVIAFTVTGDDYYPSAGYALIDATGAVGAIHAAAQGLGPTDGFTSYKAFVGNSAENPLGRLRCGRDGRHVRLDRVGVHRADVHLGEYLTGAIGSCGGTRTSLGELGDADYKTYARRHQPRHLQVSTGRGAPGPGRVFSWLAQRALPRPKRMRSCCSSAIAVVARAADSHARSPPARRAGSAEG